MAKLKHNKKRNTAFLYEALVLELTKAVVDKDNDKKKEIVKILKEFFGKGTVLNKELLLYRSILDSKSLPPLIAEKLILETRSQHASLDKKNLFFEHNKLNFAIKRKLPKTTLGNFVPNYKSLATIAQIFGDELDPKTRVLLETELIDQMTKEEEEKQKLDHIDDLTMKSFVKRFNESYGDLHEEQRTLLNRYINSSFDGATDFKIFLNEEITRLKSELKDILQIKEIREDELMLEKVQKVQTLFESFKKKQPDEEMIEEILKIQSLIRIAQE